MRSHFHKKIQKEADKVIVATSPTYLPPLSSSLPSPCVLFLKTKTLTKLKFSTQKQRAFSPTHGWSLWKVLLSLAAELFDSNQEQILSETGRWSVSLQSLWLTLVVLVKKKK